MFHSFRHYFVDFTLLLSLVRRFHIVISSIFRQVRVIPDKTRDSFVRLPQSSCRFLNERVGNELKSQLYRNFGKLYASQGRLEAALKQLANDVYYSSLESGPEHIDTAGKTCDESKENSRVPGN